MVVVAVIGVLWQGALQQQLSGESVQESGIADVTPRPVLRPDLEKTPLAYFSDYWNQLATNARPSLITIGPSRTPAILVGSRLALTTMQPVREGLLARARGRLGRAVGTGPTGGDDATVSAEEASTAPDGGDVTEPASTEGDVGDGEPPGEADARSDGSDGTNDAGSRPSGQDGPAAPRESTDADDTGQPESPPVEERTERGDEATDDVGSGEPAGQSAASGEVVSGTDGSSDADARPGTADGGQGDDAGQAESSISVEFGPYRLRAWNEAVGLALFDIMGNDVPSFTLADPVGLRSGSYVGAVSLDSEGAATITPGSLITAHAGHASEELGGLDVAIEFSEDLSVAAIINLDGALVGVAYGSPTGPRVITTPEMLTLLDDLQTVPVCRGIEVSDLTDEIREMIDVEHGVFVEYVETAAFHPQPLLQSGDILLEWGGDVVEASRQFNQLYDGELPGALVSYRVLRNGRRLTGGAVMPDMKCQPVGPEPVWLTRFGLAAEWNRGHETADGESTDGSWTVMAVAGAGPAAEAGVEERDRLLAVGGEALGSAEDRAALESIAEAEGPVLFTLQRGRRMKLVAVTPVAPREAAGPALRPSSNRSDQ